MIMVNDNLGIFYVYDHRGQTIGTQHTDLTL